MLLLLTFSSCALKPISSSYQSVKTPVTSLSHIGDGQVLFYNGADILHAIDNTARLNIWVNGKPMGQLRVKEYVVVQLPPGKYEVKLQHQDMVNIRSTHQIEIDNITKVIRVEPTIASNKLTLKYALPDNFAKYIMREL